MTLKQIGLMLVLAALYGVGCAVFQDLVTEWTR
jgi:hypothetical protein